MISSMLLQNITYLYLPYSFPNTFLIHATYIVLANADLVHTKARARTYIPGIFT